MKDLFAAIERLTLDHEDSQKSDDILVLASDDYMMLQHPVSDSVYANRVVFSSCHSISPGELYQKAIDFYQVPFGWFARQGDVIVNYLKDKKWRLHESYHALYRPLTEAQQVPIEVVEVSSDAELVDYAIMVSEIWQTSHEQMVYAIKKYKAYLNASDRRGGYLLVYQDKMPLAYANYRLSSCGDYLYLSGTGVLESHRGQGIYKALLNYRLNKGLEAGASYALVQAKQDSSSPILKHAGFKQLGVLDFYLQDE